MSVYYYDGNPIDYESSNEYDFARGNNGLIYSPEKLPMGSIIKCTYLEKCYLHNPKDF